jgi:hypothetical protein
MARGRYRKSSVVTVPIRVAAGVLGVAVFATGVVAVFVTENGPGTATLLAIGAAFIAFATLGDRIQSLELGGVNLTLRDIARQTFALAEEAERRGDDEAAEQLRATGRALQELASEYRRIRGSMSSGPQRTVALEDVVRRTRELGKSDALEPADVAAWFDDGSPEARITALALMQGNPRLRDFAAAVDAIADSQSAFEQYHGLRLAEMMVGDVTTGQRAELTAVVERALRSLRTRRDRDRNELGRRILAALGQNGAE